MPSEAQEVESRQDGFRVPVPGELTGGLWRGLSQFRAGHAEPERFFAMIEQALESVPQVFQAMMDDIEPHVEEVPDYGDGLLISLSDCQALFEYGLSEMLQFAADEDDFHLRFGWLLLEKGEAEYIRILQTLQKDSGSENS